MTESRSISVSEAVDIPADLLWKTVSDFAHIDRWSKLKIRSITGSGVGCERTVEMENGALVTEQLLARDDEGRVMRYGIVAPNPYPMLDYSSTIAIEAITPQSSRVLWSGSYIPLEQADPARTDKLLQKVYSGGIELLRQHFARQPK